MAGFIVLGICVLFFVVLYFLLQANQRRHAADADALNKWATGRGFTYTERDDELPKRWPLELFDRGYDHQAHHVVSGTHAGLDFTAFDYRYTVHTAAGTTGTNNENVFHFAVVAVGIPGPMPWMSLWHQSKVQRATHPFRDDISVGDAEFDKQYDVQSKEPDFALAALPDQTRARLLAKPLTVLSVMNDQIVAWNDQTHNKVATLPERLDTVAEFVANIPISTWQSHGCQSPIVQRPTFVT